MDLILCGLPNSGKTTLGRNVAAALRTPFVDTDQLIERDYAEATGMACSCRQIFLKEGEAAFRAREKNQIASLAHPVSVPKTEGALSLAPNRVIATGGGSLIDADNTRLLHSLGMLVYLRTPWSLLWERAQRRGLPAYLNTIHSQPQCFNKNSADVQSLFYALAAKREACYLQVAHAVIDTAYLSTHETLNSLISLWQATPLERCSKSLPGENRMERLSEPS